MQPTGREPNPYAGLVNLLELLMPRLVDHYVEHVAQLACQCAQCRRDVLSLALSSLPAMYYGSIWSADLVNLEIAWRTLSIEAIDQQVRRAIALVNEVQHHGRSAGTAAPSGVETATPLELAEKIIARLQERPLLQQLYGVPVPMCIACNEVARRTVSKFCDRCGSELVPGLPSTSLRR